MKYINLDKEKFLEIGQKKRNMEISDTWLQIAQSCGYEAPSGEAARQMYRRLYKDTYGHFPNKHKNTDTHTKPITKTINNDNTMDVVTGVTRILTIDEAVELFDIDLSEWKIEKCEYKSWETARKDVQKTIDSEKGTHIVKDTGKMFIQPLYAIHLRCVRIKPVMQEFPPIQPIKIHIDTPKEKIKKNIKETKHAIIISDTHFGFSIKKRSSLIPFHDRRALDVVRQVCRDTQPDLFIMMGDLLDFAEFSDKFAVKPEYKETAQPALEEAAFYLSTLRQENPDMEMCILEGNHDERLRRSVFNNNIASFKLQKVNQKHNEYLISLPYLLGLKELNIQYKEGYPNNSYIINQNLRLIHGDIVSTVNGDTAKKLVNKSFVSTGQGHIHREEIVSKTYHTNNGFVVTKGFSIGTLARVDGVVPAKKGKADWQQGFAELYIEDGEFGDFQVNLISIQNGKCIYNGNIYKSREEEEIIKEINSRCSYYDQEGFIL